MLKFPELKTPESIWNDGFVFQWCCKCKALHIWHFHIVRGEKVEDDFVVVSCA